MKNRFLIIASILILHSCNTTSGILPMGPDTYTISTSSELGGVTEAKKGALTEANQYCLLLGKQMLPLTTQQAVRPDWAGDPIGHYEINFRCLDTGDSELQRPHMQKSADIVIENR